ncbi:MAG: heparinase II/III family protein [Eubacteriales bacterium]
MNYVNDRFIELMGSDPSNKAVLTEMEAEVRDYMSDFSDDPSITSRWGHIYFCNDDGGRLIYNHKEKNVHRCEVCGQVFQSEEYDGVWQYFYRNQAIVVSLVSALCFKATGNKEFLDYTKDIITFYADHYLEFEIHRKEGDHYKDYETMAWGSSRIMPQGLNESIVGIRVAQAYEIIKEDIDDAFKTKIFDWFQEMCRLLKPQVDQIHNIRVWNDAAIGIMGFVCGDKELVDFAFNGEFGLNNQMAQGVTKDYFWYEGSTHYNYFLLEGVCYLVLFAHLYNYEMDAKCKDTILKMYEKGAEFTFDNGYFPNPNDGWPDLNLKTYSYQYHTMARVAGENSKLGNIIKAIEKIEAPRTILPLSDAYYLNNITPVEKLLFNPDFDYNNYKEIERAETNYPNSNYTMLRNGKLNLFLKYGLNAKSHAHPDIMGIEVVYGKTRISRDLSNAGYRSRLCNEWHRKTLCHNTVVCDGEDIASFQPGECLEYGDHHVKARAGVYPEENHNVFYGREITIGTNTVEDTFTVESKDSHNYDYVYHLESQFKVTCAIAMEDGTLGYDKNGYQHVISCKQILGDPEEVVLTAEADEITVTLTFDTKGKEAFLLETMDNPVNQRRTTLLLREKGTNITYKMKMNVKEN